MTQEIKNEESVEFNMLDYFVHYTKRGTEVPRIKNLDDLEKWLYRKAPTDAVALEDDEEVGIEFTSSSKAKV